MKQGFKIDRLVPNYRLREIEAELRNGRSRTTTSKEKGVAAVSPQTEDTIAQALMVWGDDGGSAGQ